MTEKDFKKLNRQNLLVLLAEQTERADALEEKLREAEDKINSRQLYISECGSMAEASLKLSGVFQAADEAVSCYLDNIKQMNEKQALIIQERETESQQRAEKLIHDAEQQAAEIIQNANQLAAREIEKMNNHWDEVQRKIRELDKEYSGLRGILQWSNGDLG